MKRSAIFFLIFPVFWLLSSCSSGSSGQQAGDRAAAMQGSDGEAVMSFEKNTHDFGQIVSGEKVSFAFRFTNTGDAPLLITNTRSGCGCTVGEYSREPVAPGQTGRVTVMFNSAGRRGFQSESIRIFTNGEPSEHLLRVTAEVIRN
jgi:hypothetical protein